MSGGGIRYVEWLSAQEPREDDWESWSPVWNPVGAWEDSVSYRLLAIQLPVFGVLDEHVDAVVTPLTGSLQKTADSATQTLNTANTAIYNLQTDVEPLLASLKELSEPYAPFRNNLEATMRDMAASASSLRNFSHTLERDPSVLLTGRQNQ